MHLKFATKEDVNKNLGDCSRLSERLLNLRVSAAAWQDGLRVLQHP